MTAPNIGTKKTENKRRWLAKTNTLEPGRTLNSNRLQYLVVETLGYMGPRLPATWHRVGRQSLLPHPHRPSTLHTSATALTGELIGTLQLDVAAAQSTKWVRPEWSRIIDNPSLARKSHGLAGDL